MNEWISVKDGLPNKDENDPRWSVEVLFKTNSFGIHSGYLWLEDGKNDFWMDTSENLEYNDKIVTHWMPLPEMPEKED
jgi:hypothetical protein